MYKSLGGFRAALLIGWIVLGSAGLLYAHGKGIPNWAALPVLAAFLVEYPFYLAAGFPQARERLAGRRLPFLLWASVVLPYLVYALGTGRFHWDACFRLSALALALGLWYAVLPATPTFDVAFLALLAAVMLGRYFDGVYVAPFPGTQVQILGHLALIHTAVLVLLLQRRLPAMEYGFLPNRLEVRTGVLHFLYFLPIGVPLAMVLDVAHLASPGPWWRIAGIFFGTLWVVALSEEFFFRGALFTWIGEWTGSPYASLVLTAALFGGVHLWFRGFPNWRFALVAAVAGFFYGRARMKAGSIQAGIVTHTLVVTLWRALFS